MAATEFMLWCYLKGHTDYFKVIIPSSKNIDNLKEIIHAKIQNSSSGCDAIDLTLIQTDVALEVLREAIFNGEYRPNASDRKLWPDELINAVWPEGPSHGKLHVFITLPDRQSSQFSPVVGAIGAQGLGVMEHLELRAHGYEVKPPEVDIVDDNGGVMEPLSRPRPSHILTVYQQSDPNKRFIAKKVHEESNELNIFELLHTFQPKSEHILSLHESFQTQTTSWAIFPEMDTVADYVSIQPDRLYGRVAQLCWGLISGVMYLHKFRIAHRDIKPDNLVVDSHRNFSLKIIDFDVAMRVEDEYEVVEGQCGTIGWMAPEIVEKSMYSPIKADRWSTGAVILYLLDTLREEDAVLRMTGRKLTAHNPEQRPSMLQVAAPLPDVVNERKALRSPQNTMEVYGENAMLSR